MPFDLFFSCLPSALLPTYQPLLSSISTSHLVTVLYSVYFHGVEKCVFSNFLVFLIYFVRVTFFQVVTSQIFKSSETKMSSNEFYLRYYVGHKGKFGHEFLEFEFRPDGTYLDIFLFCKNSRLNVCLTIILN